MVDGRWWMDDETYGWLDGLERSRGLLRDQFREKRRPRIDNLQQSSSPRPTRGVSIREDARVGQHTF